MIIDSHCHLDYTKIYSQLDDVVKRAIQNNVQLLLTICTTLESYNKIKLIINKYSNIYGTFGIHPHETNNYKEISSKVIIDYKKQDKKIIAIGETGLDFFYNHSDKKIQKKIFIEHILAAEKGKAGEMYLLANRNLTIQELADIISDLEGKKIKMVELPVPLMKEATKLLKWVSDNVTQAPPLATPKDVEYASQYLFYSIDKSKQELGYRPRNIRESLQDSISYFRSTGYITH